MLKLFALTPLLNVENDMDDDHILAKGVKQRIKKVGIHESEPVLGSYWRDFKVVKELYFLITLHW